MTVYNESQDERASARSQQPNDIIRYSKASYAQKRPQQPGETTTS